MRAGETHELSSWTSPPPTTPTVPPSGTQPADDSTAGRSTTAMDLRPDDESATGDATADADLQRRTVRKLDWLLLPFLAILFMLNSLDKSNIGNAETAGFSRDTGLARSDINTALAFFFAFFVSLQPLAAALGRQIGMARWVPACMSLWGLCTIGHIWVRRRWHLIVLRIIIATLEAGFYPTTVSYLSLFYTRYEFAVRLGVFYGQTAVAGALGGILSWAVFSQFPSEVAVASQPPPSDGRWRSWEMLFLLEGCLTIVVALLGFLWLPHSADTAWFFTHRERWWAEERIRLDQADAANDTTNAATKYQPYQPQRTPGATTDDTDAADSGPSEDRTRLLVDHAEEESFAVRRNFSSVSLRSLTADSGLSRHDITSAIWNYRIWLLLVCNILSAIPATAFGVFLPMVVKDLSPSLKLSPAASNLLSAPPFAFGALVLFLFTWWSDRSQRRLFPIFCGLGVLLVGLTASVLTSISWAATRYASLCVLLSGSFVASPLTVAWLSNNTPEPGKRAILLGINGWGNLAGVFSALLFTPQDADEGYIRSFVATLICVVLSFAGFLLFRSLLIYENRWRDAVMSTWTVHDCEREQLHGDVDVPDRWTTRMLSRVGLRWDEARSGDEKITYRYGM